MKVKAKVVNQEIRMKVKKVKSNINKIPFWHCYNCNLMLQIMICIIFKCTGWIVTKENHIKIKTIIIIIVILYFIINHLSIYLSLSLSALEGWHCCWPHLVSQWSFWWCWHNKPEHFFFIKYSRVTQDLKSRNVYPD